MTDSDFEPLDGDDAAPVIRVLIALAVPFLRAGVRTILDDQEDVEVLGEVSAPDEVLPAIDRLEPDLVVLDTDFERARQGFIQSIQDARPDTSILVMVNHSDEECVIRSMLADPSGPQFSDDAVSKLSECCLMALRSSARGCVPKTAEPDRLVRAIRTVAAGGVAAGAWLGSMVGRMSDSAPEAGRITSRELDIISFVARGLENKEIAVELEIAEQTVKNHLSHVMKKLGLRNRQEVAVFADAGAPGRGSGHCRLSRRCVRPTDKRCKERGPPIPRARVPGDTRRSPVDDAPVDYSISLSSLISESSLGGVSPLFAPTVCAVMIRT